MQSTLMGWHRQDRGCLRKITFSDLAMIEVKLQLDILAPDRCSFGSRIEEISDRAGAAAC